MLSFIRFSSWRLDVTSGFGWVRKVGPIGEGFGALSKGGRISRQADQGETEGCS